MEVVVHNEPKGSAGADQVEHVYTLEFYSTQKVTSVFKSVEKGRL